MKQTMIKKIVLVLFLLVDPSAAKAVAMPSEPAPGDVPGLVERNDKANRAAARHLGLPLSSIQACRKAGLPLYFSMFQVVIAVESGFQIEDVNQARFDGYNWGDMCAAWGLDFSKVVTRVDAAFTKMIEEGHPPPPVTRDEHRRRTVTGDRTMPLKPRR